MTDEMHMALAAVGVAIGLRALESFDLAATLAVDGRSPREVLEDFERVAVNRVHGAGAVS